MTKSRGPEPWVVTALAVGLCWGFLSAGGCSSSSSTTSSSGHPAATGTTGGNGGSVSTGAGPSCDAGVPVLQCPASLAPGQPLTITGMNLGGNQAIITVAGQQYAATGSSTSITTVGFVAASGDQVVTVGKKACAASCAVEFTGGGGVGGLSGTTAASTTSGLGGMGHGGNGGASTGPGAGGASTTAATTTTAATGAGGAAMGVCGMTLPTCNAPGQCGAWVDVEQVASKPAAATGGPIADGTYVLTQDTVYTGPGGATGQPAGKPQAKDTYVFQNGVLTATLSSVLNGNTEFTSYGSGTFTISGTTLTETPTCPPNMMAVSYDYSIAGNVLRLVSSQGPLASELVLTKM